MEEKERYEVHIYDDVCVDLYDNGVLDKSVNDTHKLENLLNQQDNRIKELEQESYPAYKREHQRRAYLENIEIPKLKKENQQLKQQLEDTEESYNNTMRYLNKTRSELLNLPKKIVEDIKQQIFNHFKVKNIEEYEKLSLIDALFTADTVIEILDTIMKKYGEKDESLCCNVKQ